jgi:hypothetical protein
MNFNEITAPELSGKQKENDDRFNLAYEGLKSWEFTGTAKDDAIICLQLITTQDGPEQKYKLEGMVAGDDEAIGALLVHAGLKQWVVGDIILAAAELIKEQRAQGGPPVDAILAAVKRMFPGADVKLMSVAALPFVPGGFPGSTPGDACPCPVCVARRESNKKNTNVN